IFLGSRGGLGGGELSRDVGDVIGVDRLLQLGEGLRFSLGDGDLGLGAGLRLRLGRLTRPLGLDRRGRGAILRRSRGRGDGCDERDGGGGDEPHRNLLLYRADDAPTSNNGGTLRPGMNGSPKTIAGT